MLDELFCAIILLTSERLSSITLSPLLCYCIPLVSMRLEVQFHSSLSGAIFPLSKKYRCHYRLLACEVCSFVWILLFYMTNSISWVQISNSGWFTSQEHWGANFKFCSVEIMAKKIATSDIKFSWAKWSVHSCRIAFC